MYRSYSTEISVDSFLMRASACIPAFGVFPTIMATAFLDERLKDDGTLNNKQKIRLLDLKNQYRIASIVRDLIGLAFIIKVIAIGALTPKIILSVAIVAASIVWHLHTIYTHNLLIERVQQIELAGLSATFHGQENYPL